MGLAGRGRFARGWGWQVRREPPLKVYRATTDDIGGIFPFLTSVPLHAAAR